MSTIKINRIYKSHTLSRIISLVVVCLFLTNGIAWPQYCPSSKSTLAPIAGNEQIYNEMRQMMAAKHPSHQNPSFVNVTAVSNPSEDNPIRRELNLNRRKNVSVEIRSHLQINDFLELNGREHTERVRSLANTLAGMGLKKGFAINATEAGGGVAEMMHDIVALQRDAGLDMDWLVIDGYHDFYDVTVHIHEGLQSSVKDDMTEKEIEIFDEVSVGNFERMEGEGYFKNIDFIFVEDPQTMGLIPLIKAIYPRIRIIWRCHIDASGPNRQIAEFVKDMVTGRVRSGRDRILYEYIENRAGKPAVEGGERRLSADMVIFHTEEFASGLGIQASSVPVYIMPPGINPFSYKNMPLPDDFIRATMEKYGLSPDKFTFIEISRFDPYKGPLEFMHAFAKLISGNPGMEEKVQFVYAGIVAGDNLKGLRDLQKIKAYEDYLKELYPALEKCMFVLKSEDEEGKAYLNEKQEKALLRGGAGIVSFTPERLAALTPVDIAAIEANAMQRQLDAGSERDGKDRFARKCVIQASSKEGFGLVVAEALVKGTPVIAPAIGGIKTQMDQLADLAPWLSLPYTERDRDESLRIYEEMDKRQLAGEAFDLNEAFASLERRADTGFVRSLSDAMKETYDFSLDGKNGFDYHDLGAEIKKRILDRFTTLINVGNRLGALVAAVAAQESGYTGALRSIAQKDLSVFEEGWEASGLESPREDTAQIILPGQLDIETIRALSDDENFLEAAKYFNGKVLGYKLTWEKIIDLFEILRGDRKQPAYDNDVYEKRLHSVKTMIPGQRNIDQAIRLALDTTPQGKASYELYLEKLAAEGKAVPEYPFNPKERSRLLTDSLDLENLPNMRFGTRAEVLRNAARIYEFIIGVHIFFKTNRHGSAEDDWTWEITRLPGFDNEAIAKSTGEPPASGHHRLAWFVMNYFLINNGYTPLYLKKGEGGSNGPYGIVKPPAGLYGWSDERLSSIMKPLEERVFAVTACPVRMENGLVARDGKLDIDPSLRKAGFEIRDPIAWMRCLRYAVIFNAEIAPYLSGAMRRSAYLLQHPVAVRLAFDERIDYMNELFSALELNFHRTKEILSSFGVDFMRLIYDISPEPCGNLGEADLNLSNLSPRHSPELEKALGISGLPGENTKKAKILLVGGGKMSRMVYALLPKITGALGPDVEIAGVVEPSEESRRSFTNYVKQQEIKFYPMKIPMPVFFDSIDQAVNTGNLLPEETIAYVVTPDVLHVDAVKQLSDTGINKIILEKPIAGSREDMEKIVRLRDERRLNIVVNEQYLYSKAMGNIKAYMQSKGYRPTFITMLWSKSRVLDVTNGRNISTGSVFDYDIFHQVVIANSIASYDGTVAAAWNEDMVLPGMTVPGHARGAILLRHESPTAVKSILTMDHELAMGQYGVARYMNICAENPETGGKATFFVSIGHGQNPYEYFDIIDNTDGRFDRLERYDDLGHPIVHSFYYYILGLLNDAKLPSSLDNILKVHDLIDEAEARKEYGANGYAAVKAADLNDKESMDLLSEAVRKKYPGYEIETGNVTEEHLIGSPDKTHYLWITKGHADALFNGQQGRLMPGDQAIVSRGDEIKLTGNFSYFSIGIDGGVNGATVPGSSITHLRDLPDTAGGCNVGEEEVFRRLLLAREGPGETCGVNAHLVRIDKETSFAHFHPSGDKDGGQSEIYVVFDPAELGVNDKQGLGSVDLYTPEAGREEYKHLEVDVAPGACVFIPPGVGHQADNIYALVIGIPGFLPGNEINIDLEKISKPGKRTGASITQSEKARKLQDVSRDKVVLVCGSRCEETAALLNRKGFSGDIVLARTTDELSGILKRSMDFDAIIINASSEDEKNEIQKILYGIKRPESILMNDLRDENFLQNELIRRFA